MKYALVLVTMLTASFSSYALNGKEFVDCYLKAVKERAAEIKAENPDMELCEDASDDEKGELYRLYSYMGNNGSAYYYSESSMNLESIRFHYERIQWEVECYTPRNNIFSAFGEGLGNAIGIDKHNNMAFARSVMSKVLGRDVWTENGSDMFSEHSFEYCAE